MVKRNTKEMILAAALKLFSDRGYDGVGVRDIANEVGVRESALYKHYGGKQEIFDSIINKMNGVYGQQMASYNRLWQEAQENNDDHLLEILTGMCVMMFRNDLEDETGSQLRRMLTFEQIKNTAAGVAFRDKLISDGLKYFAGAFAELIKREYYRDADPDQMALIFYSPFYLLLSKYDRQPDKYDEAVDILKKHIKHFDSLHRKEQ
jgi:AcrR family transcriptional regulator